MEDAYFNDDEFNQSSSDEDDDVTAVEEDEIDDDDEQDGGDGEVEGDIDIEDDDEPDDDEEKQYEENELSIKNPDASVNPMSQYMVNDDNDNDDEDPDGDEYLQKFNKDIKENYIMNFHPEAKLHNYDEVISMSKVVRDELGRIIDPLHKTIPYLTKYERARILGQRAKQINAGSTAFVKVPENVIDGYVIAEIELQQKRIPFIIRRPLPNGGSEYWNVKDLENIGF